MLTPLVYGPVGSNAGVAQRDRTLLAISQCCNEPLARIRGNAFECCKCCKRVVGAEPPRLSYVTLRTQDGGTVNGANERVAQWIKDWTEVDVEVTVEW